ncbi:MAG: 5-oxoprolinase subunit PxpB, partial [Phycisphaerales bacterium]
DGGGSVGVEADLDSVRTIAAGLEADWPGWVVEIVPSAGGVLVIIDPLRVSPQLAKETLAGILRGISIASGRPGPTRDLVIPVCYDPALAPDLAWVAGTLGIASDEVVGLHAGGGYVVSTMGFSPGFGYLGGLPEVLRLPRRAEPRIRVEAGSVAIAEDRTAVYPHATPGGWHLIGRSPLAMFDAERDPPALLGVGDRVRFEPISRDQYDRMIQNAGETVG